MVGPKTKKKKKKVLKKWGAQNRSAKHDVLSSVSKNIDMAPHVLFFHFLNFLKTALPPRACTETEGPTSKCLHGDM